MATETAETSVEVSKYTINGITYTKMGLLAVFFWLLFGGFIFNVMELVKPGVLPLFLMGEAGQVGASMSVTNLMMVVVPGITGLLIGPAVSFRSDRYRGKHGRRIPYITWTIPPLVLALIGIGLAPYYRDAFAKMGDTWLLSASTATMLVRGLLIAAAATTIGFALVGFVRTVSWISRTGLSFQASAALVVSVLSVVIGVILLGRIVYPYFRDGVGDLVLSPKTDTILVVGFFVVMFHVFDEFVNSVFWYLFADVVPEAFIGRFVALFNVVGVGAAMIFNGFMLPYAETHMQWIFLGAALTYLVGFAVVCWRVKEGTYPPPEDIGENPSILKQIKVYVVECFSHPIYIYTFLSTAAMSFALGASAGMIIFHRDGIGLSMNAIGKAGMVISFASMILMYPAGWAVDRWHPIRVTLLMTVPLTVAQFVAFFFMRDLTSYVLFQGGTLVFTTLFNAAGVPMLIKIFPKDKFGQFCSCNGMVRSTARMIGGALAGPFIDYMTNYSADKFAFRWVYAWIGAFQVAGLFFTWVMYVKWKNMGGDDSYVPPGSALEKELLAKGQRRPEAQGETASLPA